MQSAKKEVAFLMKILIAGDGKVGATLTRQLSREGYDLTLIDSNPRVLDASVEAYDVMTVCGNCAAMSTLRSADVENADLLIAATSADEVNLLCCLTAHGMNPNIHTIARIRSPEYTEQIYSMRSTFALSMTVNPEKQAATEIFRLLRYPGFLKRDTFARGRVEIVELRVKEDSGLCGVMLKDLGRIIKARALICTVVRNGEAVIPGGDFVLQQDDRILVTAPTAALAILLYNLGINTQKVEDVMLCGGGRISYYLASILIKSGIRVRIVEKDYDRCLSLAAQLPEASIIHGDASNLALLESEGLAECDALVAATGLDELNVVISLFGASLNVSEIITKQGRVDNLHILEKLPMGSIICPKELCANSIVRYVRAMRDQTGAALSVHSIADGRAEALEFRVTEDTRCCGVPLKDLHLKKGVLIVSISRKGVTEIPNGESSFLAGDSVVIVTSGSRIIYQLNDIFE